MSSAAVMAQFFCYPLGHYDGRVPALQHLPAGSGRADSS
jgi:hypothetical protein